MTAQVVRKGFTLIELLVVIGIVGILAAVVVLAINPAEIQKKSRDTTRISDLTTVRRAIDLAITDGETLSGSTSTSYTADSAGTRTASSTSNYVGMDVSAYLSILPMDPLQAASGATVISDGTTSVAAGVMRYEFASNGQNYELNTYLESTDNHTKVTSDGGNSSTFYEIGTDPGLDLI